MNSIKIKKHLRTGENNTEMYNFSSSFTFSSLTAFLFMHYGGNPTPHTHPFSTTMQVEGGDCRATCSHWFSPSTILFPGTELRLPGLAANSSTC